MVPRRFACLYIEAEVFVFIFVYYRKRRILLLTVLVLTECLLEQGVDTVLARAVLNIYDALYNYRDRINHVLTAHEQGAAHAADGYARSTGKVGVCIATSGPGATNLVTGIATAYMDSVPIVAITGNVAVSLLGRDSFQEVDITGITAYNKHNLLLKNVKGIAGAWGLLQRAGRGPVLIDLPKDVTSAMVGMSRSVHGASQSQPLSKSALKCRLNC